ncbi:Probable diguanylate cyclase YcdT [uncultured Clostridium sp.]|uniref:GGDEF domain-containing protein n=1 Tax=uncultured Clostridium sp. TaxID=59620 RepID=UPI000822253B|nr:GGDEF domain-containing protein [uncultured Clostridium sp.]SCI72096.1 Probable diguanylate cyclase YcdT [uncultured Clostridium sp.]
MNFEEIIKDLEKLEADKEYIKIICSNINGLEYKASREIYEKLIEYVKERNLSYAYPWIIHNYGWIQHGLGNFNKAIEVHTEAYNIFKREKDNDGILTTINALVGNYSFIQQFDRAIEYGIKGIELAEKVGNYQVLNSIKNNMSITYVEIGEFEKAKSILEQISNLPDIDVKHNKIVNLINLAECERELNNHDISIEYLENALELSKDFALNLIPGVLEEMGRTYCAKGLYNIADELFSESVRISRDTEHKLCLNEALLYWSEVDLKKERYNNAIAKLKEVEGNIESVNSIRNKNKIYSNMSLSYKALGDYENAYLYLEKVNHIQREMFKKTSVESIKNLDKKRLEDEETVYKSLYKQTEALYSVGQRITANLNRKNIYKVIAEEMKNLIKCDVLQISLINVENKTLEYKLCMNLEKDFDMVPTNLNDENRFGVYAIKHKQEILINDLNKEYYKYFNNFESYIDKLSKEQNRTSERFSQSMIFVPIMIHAKVIGVMSVQSYEKSMFTLKDVNTLKILSTYVGIALENSKLYKELKYRANYDVLTKIFNRREVLRKSEKIYNKVKKDLESYCVMMIDVDNFKKINDTYGHQIGDKVLATVANVIKESIREEDIAGRYGGEEFIVIVKDDYNSNFKIAERIRKNVEKIAINIDDNRFIKVTSSIGITKMDAKDKTLQQIISDSDKALYEAKNTGKNKVVFYC